MILADVESTREVVIEILKAYGLMVIILLFIAVMVQAAKQ